MTELEQKKLKALEIIITKNIDIKLLKNSLTGQLKHGTNFDLYNLWAEDEAKLTQEEFELIKETL